MKYTYLFIYVLGTLTFVSCKFITGKQTHPMNPAPAFLSAFTPASLPLVMKGCDIADGGLPLLNQASNSDALKIDSAGFIAYCTFATNGDYYAAISLGAADCTLPFLRTYDKSGKLIDEKFLGIGDCGGGPGIHCSEFATIRSDFSIYASDTVSIAEVDSLGMEIKESMQHYVKYKQGRMLNNGKIELSETLKQNLK